MFLFYNLRVTERDSFEPPSARLPTPATTRPKQSSRAGRSDGADPFASGPPSGSGSS